MGSRCRELPLMKSAIILLVLASLNASAASDEWVSVGVRPAATNASTPAQAASPVLAVQPAPSSSDHSSLVSELLVQMEQMQQEIASLRGVVESQGNDIRRLNQDGEARYLDLDRRLMAITTPAVDEADQKPMRRKHTKLRCRLSEKKDSKKPVLPS